MSLTLYEFIALPIGERADAVWANGEFLHAFDTVRGRCAYYALGTFWVEVVTDQATEQIVEVAPFRTGERMDSMLAGVPTLRW